MILQRAVQPQLDVPITAGLQLWLQADDLTSLRAKEAVTVWPDKSGNNRNATQNSAPNQPTLSENTINGRRAVRFDGKDDLLDFSPITDVRTVFIVLRDREKDKNHGSILGNNPNVMHHNFQANGNTHLLNWWGGEVRNGTGAVNGIETPNLEIRKSTDFQVVSIQTTGNARVDAVSDFEPYTYSWDGDIAEVLIYNSLLSATDKKSVEAYLTAKYGRSTPNEPQGEVTWTTIANSLSGGEEYLDTGLQANTTYWYRCVPVEEELTPGKSGHTTTLQELALPLAPHPPTFSEVGSTSLKVHAPALPENAKYMELQFKQADQPNASHITFEQAFGSEQVRVVAGLSAETEYEFRFVAVNAKGKAIGDSATAITLVLPPLPPDPPSIEQVGQTSVVLKMPGLSLRAETLQLQIKASNDTEFTTLSNQIEPLSLFTASNLVAGRAYLFRCVAVNAGGSTVGTAAGTTTDWPLPESPSRPNFVMVTDETVTIKTPDQLPRYASSLTLQARLASSSFPFLTATQDLGVNQVWECRGLQSGTKYEFRYLAVNSTGGSLGPVGEIVTLVPQVTWSAGTGIDCLGIRSPDNGISIQSGAVVNLDSYLATDYDIRQVNIGDVTRTSQHSDTCIYTWSASAGAFMGQGNKAQKTQWIAPTMPGLYTITLTVDDQGGSNKKTTENGSRHDSSAGFNDAPHKYQVTINVLP